MRNLIGSTIEHYQILVKIRETPTRVLFKAHDSKSQTDVGVDVVKSAWLKPDELLGLINKQARKTADLIHPNIANVTDTGLHNGLIYIVYNFSPAQPMRRFFNRTYPWKEMARELVSIAHALAYAHENDVIHGALHPASIVLDAKRNPVLFDFGFEHIITDYILAHAPGTWINRWGFEYRTLSQLNGEAPSILSDIYALGIMLYEWLIGKIPQTDATILGTLQKRMVTTIINKKEAASVPPVIQDLIRKCVARDPVDRYQSMQEVYIVLARGALDMSLTKKMVRKPLAIPVKRFRLTRSSFRWVGLAAVLMGIALVVFLNRSTIYNMYAPPSSPTLPPIATKPLLIPTQTIRPTSTPLPTQTVIPPTATPLAFPVHQDVSIYSVVNQTLSPENANKMVMLSVWGIGDVNDLASAPDGSSVAAASSIGIFIFDSQSLQLEKYIDTRSSITALEFSRDSKMLATGDSDGLIQIWNTQTWTESETRYSGHLQTVLDLAFSPDGTRLASVDISSRLIQWRVNSSDGPQSKSIDVIGGATSLAYSADGVRIVTGGNDLLINVWITDTLNFEKKIPFSGKIVDIATVRGADDLFVIGGNDQRVALLDLNSGLDPKTVGYLQYPLTDVEASPDGELLAAGDLNGGIAVWEVNDDQFKEVMNPKNYVIGNTVDLENPGSPHSLKFNSDGSLIFSSLHNGIIRSINAVTGAEAQQNQMLNAHVKKMAVSHNSQHLITQQDNDTLTIWNIWNGTIRYQLQGEIKAGDPFSQNDEWFAVASVGNGPSSVGIYNLLNGNDVYTIKNQPRLKTLQFINNSMQLIEVYDSFIELWSMSNGQKLETNPELDGTGCKTIKDVDDQPVVSITTYQYVVTNVNNKRGLCVFAPEQWKVAIDEARGLIVFGGESMLAISDARDPHKEVQNLRGVNRKNIVSLAISSNGDMIAAAYDNHSIHIWDTATRDELTSVEDGLFGHSDSITDLRFTPDGKLLISVSMDGTIRLWGVP